MAKPLPVNTLRLLYLGLHSEFGIAALLLGYAQWTNGKTPNL
jgi:hypothetical protein